jgi:glycosidase
MPSVNVPASAPSQLANASLVPAGSVHPSPVDWRDQVLYFLLPDRFSDGREGTRQLYDRTTPGAFTAANKASWMARGKVFNGGTIKGVESKLPYLANLGVSALWLGPVWKQRADLQTYHGYGIQDFLDVDPRFGTRQDLRDLVDAAHALGIYVILDIIYNHSGNNWFYDDVSGPVPTLDYRFEPPYPFRAWRSATGSPIANITSRDDAVWPEEFQDPNFYTRAGQIRGHGWDPAEWENPLDPRTEFRRGDFFDLKDLRIQERQPFTSDGDARRVLDALCKVYQYWIALTDCDGVRIDTVKHVSFEASRNFCGALREYAESIGKQNFLLLGEVTGGANMARDYLDLFGRNLDAALDLGGPAGTLASFAKGFVPAARFFEQFGGHDALGSHREVGRYHVSVLDDHDMVGRDKARFSAANSISARHEQMALAVGIQLTTLGIPCIYYGTEQAFEGSIRDHDATIEPLDSHGRIPFDDRYIREAMFGGEFGAFGTENCHFFDPDHPTYLRIAAIARLVSRKDSIGLALRRGRQYPRDVRFTSEFIQSPASALSAWSRILFDREVVVAINPNGTASSGADITVDAQLHPSNSQLTTLYRSDWTDPQLRTAPSLAPLTVQSTQGRSFVHVDLPPAGMVILA